MNTAERKAGPRSRWAEKTALKTSVCRAREVGSLRTVSLYAWAGAAVCRVRGKGKHEELAC